MSAFSCWKASCWAVSHTHALSFLSKSLKGFVFSARFGQNFIRWLTKPKKRLRSAMFWGSAMSVIALTLEGSFLIPSLSMIWPKYCNLDWENKHFSRLSVSFLSTSLSRTCLSRLSCSAWSLPMIRISSMRHLTPSIPESSLSILFWKYSGAEDMPKGRRLNM